MSFEVGDRVTNGSAAGEVLFVFEPYLVVLVDGVAQPIVVNESAVVLEVPLVFEVGHNYKFPDGDVIFHVVHQIDSEHFVVWFQPANGGFEVTIATPAQREQVVEV